MSNRRSQIILVLAVVAALIGVAVLAVPGSPAHKSPTLGLDLQGGIEVVLQAQPPPGHTLTDADLDRAVNIIRNRIDKLGVSEPEVRKQGNNQIAVQLAGVFDQARAVQIIGSTAQLELYKLEDDLVRPSINPLSDQPVPQENLYSLLAPVSSSAGDNGAGYYLFNAKKKLVAGPQPTKEELLDSRTVKKLLKKGELPKGYKIFGRPAKTKVVTCDESARVCPGLSAAPAPGKTYYYLFKYDPEATKDAIPEMTGKDLKLSGTRQDFDTQGGGEPIVLMQFTGSGADKFHNITRDLSREGRLRESRLPAGTPKDAAFGHFAIVLDDEIKSYPSIDFDENPDGIPGDNGAQISGIGSVREAKDLALVLQTGALPVKFNPVDQTTVSATLGKDSLREAVRAAIAGLILVGIFLILLYRFLGVVAVLGLGIYAALLYAAILLLNVTLTLPGFAGMILTIGVAADANVIIFERIKEEFRAGKSIRAAIGAGYAKGFHTIVDANVVTAITALVLFAVATAGVKGFALMLLVGTAISLLTAVAATRAMLGLLAGFRWFDSPRFMGANAQGIPKWQRIDVVGRRRLWFILSLVAIGVSVLALAVKGLNLGIDFKGGSQVTFKTPAPVSIADVRSTASQVGIQDATIQGRGSQFGTESYKSYQVRARELTQPQQNRLGDALRTKYKVTAVQIKTVSASFSRQILRGALLAILVSFALIALYVTIRYQWRFAVPILRTLVNDVLITLGVYSLSGREVTAPTVAALLTILGFSIYDTIIVFDRVRENMKLMPRATIATIANVSVWEVLRRSMVTSFITLLPIIALFIFGGATLQDFAFAIMVGIIIGAVSTIFIATPLLTVLMERDPEYARRARAEAAEKGLKPGRTATEWLAGAASRGRQPEVEEAEPVAELAPSIDGGDGAPTPATASSSPADARRERRRQRRRTRPHGRAR